MMTDFGTSSLSQICNSHCRTTQIIDSHYSSSKVRISLSLIEQKHFNLLGDIKELMTNNFIFLSLNDLLE